MLLRSILSLANMTKNEPLVAVVQAWGYGWPDRAHLLGGTVGSWGLPDRQSGPPVHQEKGQLQIPENQPPRPLPSHRRLGVRREVDAVGEKGLKQSPPAPQPVSKKGS